MKSEDCKRNPVECMRKKEAELYFKIYDEGLGWTK